MIDTVQTVDNLLKKGFYLYSGCCLYCEEDIEKAEYMNRFTLFYMIKVFHATKKKSIYKFL